MTRALDSRLAEALLGDEASLEADDRVAYCELLGDLGLAAGSVAPPAGGRERLLAEIDPFDEGLFIRDEELLDALARFFDLSQAAARAIVEKASRPVAWEVTRMPGMRLFHLKAGPAFAHTDAGLVRYDPGGRFPHHVHMGLERTLILEGSLRTDDGVVHRPGDRLDQPLGTAHAFEVLDAQCTFALTLEEGLDIAGRGPSRKAKRP
jgi:quercetin dioxygenase-like cupin family protein